MPLYQNKGDCLLVEFNEPYSLPMVMSAIHEIAERCQRERLDKVLVDILKSEGNPNIYDRYQFGTEIARAWGPVIKAAVVARASIINWMGETVAVNRGARILVTDDAGEAMRWLRVAERE